VSALLLDALHIPVPAQTCQSLKHSNDYSLVIIRPPEVNSLCFCTVLFYLLVYAVEVVARMVHLGDLVMGLDPRIFGVDGQQHSGEQLPC